MAGNATEEASPSPTEASTAEQNGEEIQSISQQPQEHSEGMETIAEQTSEESLHTGEADPAGWWKCFHQSTRAMRLQGPTMCR